MVRCTILPTHEKNNYSTCNMISSNSITYIYGCNLDFNTLLSDEIADNSNNDIVPTPYELNNSNCLYWDTDILSNYLSAKVTDIFLHLNIQGLSPNIQGLFKVAHRKLFYLIQPNRNLHLSSLVSPKGQSLGLCSLFCTFLPWRILWKNMVLTVWCMRMTRSSISQ